MIRIIIADDHTLVRQGIRSLIERHHNIEVISETSDGLETLEKLKMTHPDILIMDISMPHLTGIQVLEHIQNDGLNTRVIILSMYSNELLIRRALKFGAKAYLLKNALKEELIQAILAVYQRSDYTNSLISNLQIDLPNQKQNDISDQLDLLTTREKEILKLIAEGNTNASIARLLHLSIKTIEKHRSNLLNKLKVQDTAALIRLAIKSHLVFIDDVHSNPE
jgi:DNA-binding NarL/FixJ family response regulator